MLETVRTVFRSIQLQNNNLFQILCDKNSVSFLKTRSSTVTPFRTTMVVKRPFPPTLYKEGNKPRLRARTFYFDFVEDTNIRPEPIVDIVLTSYVQGVGNPGDIVSMKRSTAYNKLLIPGLADYASTEMIEYSKKLKSDLELQETQIPPSVDMCMKFLQRAVILIEMNQFTEWTLEPWHVRASARKAGIHILSDESIKLPTKPIKGPDMALEGKEFFVTVIINKKHTVKVRCKIHHWTANAAERLPFEPEFWLTRGELLFPEDEQTNKENSTPSPP